MVIIIKDGLLHLLALVADGARESPFHSLFISMRYSETVSQIRYVTYLLCKKTLKSQTQQQASIGGYWRT